VVQRATNPSPLVEFLVNVVPSTSTVAPPNHPDTYTPPDVDAPIPKPFSSPADEIWRTHCQEPAADTFATNPSVPPPNGTLMAPNVEAPRMTPVM
jgi:hypothetical protein